MHLPISVRWSYVQQITAALIASTSGISDGMHYGWSAPVMPLLLSGETPIQITKTHETWLESIYFFAGILGIPVTIYLVKTIGPQKTIMVSSSASLISWILIGLASSVEYLYAARVLSGAAADVAFVATPMYILEIAEPRIRGFLTAFLYVMMLIGILVIYSVAPFTEFYVPSIIGASILGFQLVTLMLMPESPYFLLGKGKKSAALVSLTKFRVSSSSVEVQREFKEMENLLEKQREKKGRPQDLFLVAENRKCAFIAFSLLTLQQFSGISAILMNVHAILISAGSSYLDENSSGISFSLCMVVAGTVCCVLVDRFGRKMLMVVSSVLVGMCLMVLGTYFLLKKWDFELAELSWIPLVALMFYAVGFKMGLGILPQIISAEIFSSKIKGVGLSLTDGVYTVMAAVSVIVYQQVVKSFGFEVVFFGFAVIAFSAAGFTVFFVPETKGKSFEEIQNELHRTQITNK